eukprot:11615271-Alexandrium_andersonii.AAC.1
MAHSRHVLPPAQRAGQGRQPGRPPDPDPGAVVGTAVQAREGQHPQERGRRIPSRTVLGQRLREGQ